MPLQRENREAQTVAVTLTQFAVTLGLQQQGQMRKGRHGILPPKGTVEQYMQRRGRQPFLTAYHMGHFHQMVVHNIGQMVSRKFICRFIKNLVIKNGRVYHYFPTNQVVHMHIFVRLYLETHHVLLTGSNQRVYLFFRKSQ